MREHPYIEEDDAVALIGGAVSDAAGELLVFGGDRSTPMALVIAGTAESDPYRDARMLCMALETSLPEQTLEYLTIGLAQLLEEKRRVERVKREARFAQELQAHEEETRRAEQYAAQQEVTEKIDRPQPPEAPERTKRRFVRDEE